jgi:hypothetical protein
MLGPHRDGTTADARLAEGWLRGELRAVWRAEAGEGYSGLAVAGDWLFGGLGPRGTPAVGGERRPRRRACRRS